MMNKILSIAFPVGGILLIVFGMDSTRSFNSGVSRFFTGSPANKAIWMLIGGIVAAIARLFGLLRPAK